MKIEDLEKLGLSKTESTLYLAMLKLGSADVKTLVYETGFFKANTYDAMEKLCEKGLISKIIQNNVRTYNLEDPDTLIEYIETKKSELDDKKRLAKKLSEQVKLSKDNIHSSETAVVLRGITGVKKMHRDMLDEGKDYVSFGAPEESDKLIPEYYWRNMHKRQVEKGIKAKLLFNKSLEYWKDAIPHKEIELRFFEKEFEPLTETTIYGDKVAITVYTEKPVVTLIKNKHMANSYRGIFEILWKQSKK
ncbi:hypothetical protein K9L97_02580 [Candidatus Woesearchaeota archaeon]|nr:hypothetical protein [Candidatus Woesearchaeota archaeon]